MKDGKCIIERRYEYYSRDGITWTKWFNYHTCDSVLEANEMLKGYKKDKEAFKKLHGEYRIKDLQSDK